jgi:hypothetical protein
MLRPSNTASSTIENSAHWRRHHRKPLRQKVTLRMAIRCPMVRSLAVLPQEKRLRVLALFSLAHGPRKVPNTPSRVGLLTPNQCFSLTKWWRRWYCLIQRQTMKTMTGPRVIQVSPLRLRMVDHPGCKGLFFVVFTVRSPVRRFRAGCTLNSYQPCDGTVTDDTQVLLDLPFLSNPIIVNTIIFEIGDG